MSAEYISNPDEAKEYLPRYRLFYFAIAFTFVVFSTRLWILQVIQGSELREFSEKNRIRQIKITAPRGLMLDREGKILVENHPGFEAILSPQYIEDLDELASSVAPIVGMEPAKLVQKVQKSRKQNGPFAPLKLKDNLSRDEVFRLKRIRLETPGLDIQESVVRHYPLLEDGAQLFGYVSEISKRQIPLYNQLYKDINFEQGDLIGQTGLEEVLEKNIRGSDGTQFLQVDAYGRETTTSTPNIYGEQISDKDPLPGNNVVLTIDKDVQQAAYKSFQDNKRVGGLIAMKSNGEVLAWVSAPSFDPNEFARGMNQQLFSKLSNDPFKPFRNKVLQDLYSPGSTFKAFMALAALQEKIVTPTTVINCPGSLMFGKRPYHDHFEHGGAGNITIYEALERSSNVFFYKMGIALGIDKMYNYISPLGIGQKTGIELPREVGGRMPSAEWKKKQIGEEWQLGENLSTAIGQGFVQVSPIQMAVAYNAIALSGKVVKPFVVKKILDADGKTVTETQPKILRDLQQPQLTGISISPETFKVVQDGLKLVANGERGTATFLRIPGVQMAGKTGTSQVMNISASEIYSRCDARPIMQRHNGWFVAWAPADNPEIVVAALAEHACHGNVAAGPLVRDTVRAYFEKYHPEIIAEALKNKKARAAFKKPVTPTVNDEE